MNRSHTFCEPCRGTGYVQGSGFAAASAARELAEGEVHGVSIMQKHDGCAGRGLVVEVRA